MFPDTHLSVLSYNRCVGKLPAGMSAEAVLTEIARCFELEPVSLGDELGGQPCTPPCLDAGYDAPSPVTITHRLSAVEETLWALPTTACAVPSAPTEQEVIYMFIAQSWYVLRPRMGNLSAQECSPLEEIGCQILLDKILNPIFRIGDCTSGNYMVYGKSIALHAALAVTEGKANTGTTTDCRNVCFKIQWTVAKARRVWSA
jgi:hypothetical protein